MAHKAGIGNQQTQAKRREDDSQIGSPANSSTSTREVNEIVSKLVTSASISTQSTDLGPSASAARVSKGIP